MNGHGGDKFAWYSFYSGILYAQAGALVLTYDPIGEGERNRERRSVTRQHDTPVPPEEMGRRMAGLMVTDVRQAVTYLLNGRKSTPAGSLRPGTRWARSSSGSPALSRRGCAPAFWWGAATSTDPAGTGISSGHTMCQAIPYQVAAVPGRPGAVLYHLHALRGATFVFNGTADGVVTSEPEGPQAFFADLQKRTSRFTAVSRMCSSTDSFRAWVIDPTL